LSRLAYTWIGVTLLSIFFYLVAISLYELGGMNGASQFSGFTLTTNHILGTRSMSWLLILFVPIIGMIFDVCGKVFSNAKRGGRCRHDDAEYRRPKTLVAG
jgi:hypothetical protein